MTHIINERRDRNTGKILMTIAANQNLLTIEPWIVINSPTLVSSLPKTDVDRLRHLTNKQQVSRLHHYWKLQKQFDHHC